MNKNITGIILAGGKSSRMGFDKGLMNVNGKNSIEYAVEALEPITERIIIISNNDSYDYLGLPVYEDIVKGKGPIGGIFTGLTVSDTEKNLVVACDMPFISSELLEFILENTEFYEIALASFENKIQPLCGYYLKETAMRLRELISDDILKMQEAIQFFHYKKIAVNKAIKFYTPELSMNINTPMELKNIFKIQL